MGKSPTNNIYKRSFIERDMKTITNLEDMEKNNKLIVEFMGLNYEHEMAFIWESLYEQGYRNKDILNYPEKYKHYHNSWGELMPVLDRIKSLGFEYAICSINIKGEDLSEIMISPVVKGDNIVIHTRTDESLIQATYSAVVQFITWYNNT